MLSNFKEYEIAHVPYEENTSADVISRLTSTRSLGINHSFVHETKRTLRIEPRGKTIMVVAGPTSPS